MTAKPVDTSFTWNWINGLIGVDEVYYKYKMDALDTVQKTMTDAEQRARVLVNDVSKQVSDLIDTKTQKIEEKANNFLIFEGIIGAITALLVFH